MAKLTRERLSVNACWCGEPVRIASNECDRHYWLRCLAFRESSEAAQWAAQASERSRDLTDSTSNGCRQ
jgi:hypothetical protein